MKKAVLAVLAFYQKFLTLFGYGSCRYYPTCSEYAKWQFQKNNFFVASVQSLLRILRCNQLFRGGIDYPVVRCSQKGTIYKKIDVKFWLIPKSKQKCYIIKKI